MLIKDNPYIPSEDRDFFILIKIALWQKVEEKLSSSPDWNNIYRLAEEQTVHGLIADAIGIYCEEYPDVNIDMDRYDLFLSNCGHIIRSNWNIDNVQARVCKLLEERNIAYVVLKGQGVASCYPKPLLRCSGDIDLLLKTSQFNEALSILSAISAGEAETQKDQLHASCMIDDIEVELHAEEFKTFGKKVMTSFTQLKEQMLDEADFRTYTCNESSIALAPATFDAFYIFLHFVKHYYHDGLGLRQLTDWVMFLNSNADNINVSTLEEYLRHFGMVAEWNTFLLFVNEHLGLPESISTHLTMHDAKTSGRNKEKSYKRIWKECKKTGNFGHTEINSEIPLSRLAMYKRDFIYAHVRAAKKWDLSPTLAISQLLEFYSYNINLLFCKIFHLRK